MNYRKKVVLMLGVLSYLNLGTFSQAAPLTVDHTSVAGVQQASNDKKTIKISGSVRDAAGESIIGATILEKGTSNGVVSDMDGNFSMTVAASKQANSPNLYQRCQCCGYKAFLVIQIYKYIQFVSRLATFGHITQRKQDFSIFTTIQIHTELHFLDYLQDIEFT